MIRERVHRPLVAAGGPPALGASEGDGDVVTQRDVSRVQEKADRVMDFAFARVRGESAKELADALAADISKLEKAWPRTQTAFSLTALKSFMDSIIEIPNAVVSMGMKMGNDVRNVFVAKEYLAAAQRVQNDVHRHLIPIYKQAIIPAQDLAMERGVPRRQWDEVVIESPDIRRNVLTALNSAKAGIQEYAFLEGIRPAILDLPLVGLMLKGLRHLGAATVAMAEATGRVVETFDDMYTLTDKIATATIWASRVALAGGAAYFLYWALRSKERS